jgi:hypothetical protein
MRLTHKFQVSAIVLLAALMLAACAAQPSGTVTPGPTLTATPPALTCPSDFCRKVEMSPYDAIDCATDTSRTLDAFQKITADMDFRKVCALVGIPDWETGSGLLIYVYDLKDGTQVLIGFGGPTDLVYVIHMLKDGSSEAILQSKQ